MTSQRISLSDSPSFAGTRSISADGDLYGLVSNEILILSSADGVLYETSFKRHNKLRSIRVWCAVVRLVRGELFGDDHKVRIGKKSLEN